MDVEERLATLNGDAIDLVFNCLWDIERAGLPALNERQKEELREWVQLAGGSDCYRSLSAVLRHIGM